MKKIAIIIATMSIWICCVQAVNIETVIIGNPGNIADTRYETPGYGAVNYTFNIGTYEVTAGQYCEFLNAVAATDTYGLYNTEMDTFAYGCQITRKSESGSYTYDFSGRPSGTEADWINRPVNFVSWGDAARFANWLHNGQPTGAQDLTTTEDGAYYLNGATSTTDLMAVSRESDWKWAIPTEDEWYKAAYHKNDGMASNYFDYATSSDSIPSNNLVEPIDPGNNATFYRQGNDYTIYGPYWRTEFGAHENSESPYGTFDQSGNVWEWNEGTMDPLHRIIRGGSYNADYNYMHADYRFSIDPTDEGDGFGFRVAEVPEPTTIILFSLGSLVLIRRRK